MHDLKDEISIRQHECAVGDDVGLLRIGHFETARHVRARLSS